MTDNIILRRFTESISPDQQDPSASVLIFGSTPEAHTYYSLVQSFDSRIYLCMTQDTFRRRLTEDALIKLVILFDTDLSADVQHALSALCERSDPLHIATVRIVSLMESDADADAFEVAYRAFKVDASDAADQVYHETKQTLDRAIHALLDRPRLVISTN